MIAFTSRHYNLYQQYPQLPLRMTTTGRTFDFYRHLVFIQEFQCIATANRAHRRLSMAIWATLFFNGYIWREEGKKITWFLRIFGNPHLGAKEGVMSLLATKTTIQIWLLAVLTLVVIILGGQKLELKACRSDGIT
ncbi:hypothetical protein SNK05_008228 [Fusarium graminearum]